MQITKEQALEAISNLRAVSSMHYDAYGDWKVVTSFMDQLARYSDYWKLIMLVTDEDESNGPGPFTKVMIEHEDKIGPVETVEQREVHMDCVIADLKLRGIW